MTEDAKSPSSNEVYIQTENLVKVYSKRRVVSDVSIRVDAGEVVGLLGPNGAGKTTTFYMVVGMIRPSGGQIFLGIKTSQRRRCTNVQEWE